MSNRVIVLMSGMVLWCGGLAQATNIDFHNNGTIQAGDAYDFVQLFDFASVDMTGGSAHNFSAYNNSVLNVCAGEVLNTMVSYDASCITFSGGSSHLSLAAGGCSSVQIYGGLLTAVISASDTSEIHIYGYGFDLKPTGNLTGYFQDGTGFSYYLRGPTTPAQVELHTVPEPCCIALFGAAILIRPNRRKLS